MTRHWLGLVQARQARQAHQQVLAPTADLGERATDGPGSLDELGRRVPPRLQNGSTGEFRRQGRSNRLDLRQFGHRNTLPPQRPALDSGSHRMAGRYSNRLLPPTRRVFR